MDFMSDTSLPTPTPSPSSSSSDNSSLLNTFEMESFSSLENGRLLKNKNNNTSMENASSNSILGSTLQKNNILNSWQKTRINKKISHKPKLDENKRRNKFGILEEEITETSDILSNGLHKSLQSLPEEPVSKLMNNTVEDSLMNLKLAKIEKDKLKKANKLLLSANEDLQRQADSLKQENSNLSNQLNSVTSSDKTSNSSDQILTIESLVKKLQKYKFISQEQESVIRDLRKQLEIASRANRTNEQQQQQQSQSMEHNPDLQQKDTLLDNTDFLISMNGMVGSQGFQSSIRRPSVPNDTKKSRDLVDHNYSGQTQNYLDNEEKKTTTQNNKSKGFINNENVNSEKEKEFIEELDIIKKMVKELRPLLDYVSSIENIKEKHEELNKSDSSLENEETPSEKKDRQDRQDKVEKHSTANDFLKSLSERVDKKKKLQKELIDLENDEYIKMIEKISNPIDLSQKEYKAKPLRVGDLLLDEQDFVNLMQSNHRTKPTNIDLQTLKSLSNNVGSDTWIDDSFEHNYEENGIAPRSDMNKFSYLDDILQTTKDEFTELISRFNTLYNDTLKTDPTHNFRANKRSIHVLSELLQQINTKRQLIYKLSQTLKRGLREPQVSVPMEAPTSDDRYIDDQLVW